MTVATIGPHAALALVGPDLVRLHLGAAAAIVAASLVARVGAAADAAIAPGRGWPRPKRMRSARSSSADW